jgi:Ca2+-transporting ATPase
VLLLLSLYGPLHVIFKTIEPSFTEWLLIGPITFIPFIATEITKWILNSSAKAKESSRVSA